MDRTKANNLIAAVMFGVLFLIIVLYIHGRISHLVAIISGIGIICGYTITRHFLSAATSEEDKEKEKVQRALRKTKVTRTREGTIFEVATALILICSLVIGIANHTFEQGDSTLRDYAFCCIAAIALLILAYHPFWGSSLGNFTNAEQYKLLIRKNRVGAVATALLALIVSIRPLWNTLVIAILIGLVVVWWGIDFLFLLLYKRNK